MPDRRSIQKSFPWLRTGLGVAMALALAGAAFGAPKPVVAAVAAAPEIRIEPTTLYFGAATPSTAAGRLPAENLPAARPEVPAELREKAARPGGVRVIVRLATGFTPEGRLATGQQVRDQRQAIGRTQDTVLNRLSGTTFRLHARYEYIPFLALMVDAPALDRLASLPEVAGVEEDVFERPNLATSTAVIGAGVAWAKGLTGSGQVIAVLDTGVDKTHPFFSSGSHNKVVSEACYSSAINGTTSLCPGGATEAVGPGTGVNCAVSGCDHGTHVAGIAAGNDGVGPNFGVARDADVIAIQVFSQDFWFGLGAWVSDQIRGLERVYALSGDFDVAAVNMSLGGGLYSSRDSCDFDNTARKAAIDNLRSIDIATIASSGNDYYSFGIGAPACISSAVGVGATQDDDTIADFSNIAPFLDLMAPGVDVNSSVPGGGLANFNGTSMAAPHVAGAWAILKQVHPSATVSEILSILRNTAVAVSGRGVSDLRRINLGRALTAGPFVTQEFIIHNDGGAVLSIFDLQLETPAPWIHWTPEAPFDVAPGGSRRVAVSVAFNAAPNGTTLNRLIVTSTDSDESIYPGAVILAIGKTTCYPLTRTRTGSGANPQPFPQSSPGCPPGQFRAGETIQLTASPSIGFGVESWSGTNDDSVTSLTNVLTMPAAPHEVSVTYFAACYTLTRTHTGSGTDPLASPASSSDCPAGEYHYGEHIDLSASPAQGWRVRSWSGTDNDASRGLTNVLTMPAGPVTVTVNYQEGLPGVLLVAADSFYLTYYTEALDALGRVYDVWDVVANGIPDSASLAAYPRVVWISGFGTGLNSEAEASLAAYLDGGGSLFLSAGEYIWVYGYTPFIADYLKVGTFIQDVSYLNVTGQGTAFSGLGPYDLSFSNFSDVLNPAAGAETAFVSGFGSAGVSYAGPNFRTVFLGFPFEALPTAAARKDVLEAGLDYIGTVFADVPRGYWAKKWIEAVYRNGVSSGCGTNPRTYCPDGLVTRGQMAVFLLLAKEGAAYVPPPCTTAPFNDVPAASPLCPWIQELTNRGVTSGCGGGNYCPETVVTRSQVAVFLLSTLEGPGYAPPACTPPAPFNDVPLDSPFCPWIQELAQRGITGGCGGGSFCASNPVNRAQMAVFLVTNFRLPIF